VDSRVRGLVRKAVSYILLLFGGLYRVRVGSLLENELSIFFLSLFHLQPIICQNAVFGIYTVIFVVCDEPRSNCLQQWGGHHLLTPFFLMTP